MTAQIRRRHREPRGAALWFARLYTIAAISSLSATSVSAHAVDGCNDYRHPSPGISVVAHQLKSSVLTIKSRNNKGAAFLIDRERGLFLTARHVVRANIGDNMPPVQGMFPNKEIVNLSVIDDDAELDVALLETTQSIDLSSRTEFELSFRDHEQQVGYLDASQSSFDRPWIRLIEQVGEYRRESNGQIMVEVRKVTGGGSGAPVIRGTNGLVIGFVREKTTNDVAIVQSIISLENFLNKNSIHNLPRRISELVVSPTEFDESEWHGLFQVEGAERHSNFRLAGMIQMMWESPPWPDLRSKIGDCEILIAANNRELGKYASYLHTMAYNVNPNVHAAKAVFNAAEEKSRAGEVEVAGTLYDTAATLYAGAIAARLQESYGGGFVTALLAATGYVETPIPMAKVGRIDNYKLHQDEYAPVDSTTFVSNAIAPFTTSVDFANFSLPTTPRQENTMGVMFHDFQTARLKAAKLAPGGGSTAATQYDVFLSAAWGSQVSRNKQYRALNYQTMGDALFSLDLFEDSARAYASAWQNGLNSELTLRNYGYASSLAENRRIAVDSLLRDEIASFTAMDSKTLHRLVTDIGEIRSDM